MSHAVATMKYGIEDYLAAESETDQRHEYVAGAVYAMTGGSKRHNRIALNVASRLLAQVGESGCQVHMADVRLRIDTADVVYYPDVMLSCDAQDDHPLYSTAPSMILEVLSPPTAATDRREKRLAYLGLPSLLAYVIADSDVRQVEVWQRGDDGPVRRDLGESDPLVIDCDTCRVSLSLDDFYDKVPGLAR